MRHKGAWIISSAAAVAGALVTAQVVGCGLVKFKTMTSDTVLAPDAGIAAAAAAMDEGSPAAEAAASLGAASSGAASAKGAVAAVQAHTESAELLVQKARPHADPVGKATLAVASDEHAAALANARSAQQSLASVQAAHGRILAELQEQHQRYQKLAGEWYVVWGLRIEKAFWTAAITWLLVSIGSLLLGGGSPLSWLGRLRGLIRGPRWIGETFVK